MAAPRVLRGADVLVYINGQKYTQVREVRYAMDYGEYEIYGVDDPFPQEIAPGGRISYRGSVSGLKLRADGGLQGAGIRGIITSVLETPYISLRIKDRATGEDLVYSTKTKVSNESWSVPSKGIVVVSFNFIGAKPYQPLDRVVPNKKNMSEV